MLLEQASNTPIVFSTLRDNALTIETVKIRRLTMVAGRNNGGNAPIAEKIRLVIAEDQALLAEVLPGLLHTASCGGIEVVHICLTRSQLFRTLRKTTPDVLLCDVWMPNNSGDPPLPCDASSLEAIKRQSPHTAILLLSGNADMTLVKQLLDAGADGFLDKNALLEQLCQAIERVKRGDKYITPPFWTEISLLNASSNESIRTQLLTGRRGDVLRLLLEGFSPNKIADMLPIGKKHVDKKIAEVKSILGVETHIQILRACIRLGIIKL